MRRTFTAAAALTIPAIGSPGLATPCKDPKTGKFMECPEKATPKPTWCEDANGRFAKCGTPGATPM